MPSTTSSPPFHAEHIGSFLRPAALLRARDEHAARRMSADDLRAIEDASIRDFVALQESLGFQAVTDGEFRRSTYTENFTTSGLSGVSADQTGDGAWAYTDASGHRERARVLTVNCRIGWNRPANAADFAFLAGVTGNTAKMTLPGPCYIHFRAGRERISRDVYPRLDDFWTDLIAAYAAELNALAAAGCRYVQLDETSIAKLGDAKIRDALAARGDPWEALLDQYLAVINAIVARAPAGMRIGMHLCRGNRMGHWQAAGGYDTVADKVFRGLSIDFFFLEYDSERAGSFEPLRLVPEHKSIVLGLVSTKAADLEGADALMARVRDCARYVGLERLAISPQCGFSSSEKANTIMTYDQAVAKLRRVAEVARRVWG
ncbi:MAG: 5-methyltetrahydropteroyltriglutamate--homocysteine S-methyltransferase [Rhizobiales bacterium]|nr:5-methyltetrahydropteroyltriglutamate--homocysteine S-methyltransferase [Hyphomicrobiales bacterium]